VIKVFAIGDVVGRAGRHAIEQSIDSIRKEHSPDILILNGENSAGGFGITKKIFHQYIDDFGFDCVTTGNHWHDKKEIIPFVEETDQLLIPANMVNVSDETAGLKILTSKTGVKFAIINLIGKAFMHDGNRNPFQAASRLVAKIPDSVKVRIVDMHAEATSEKAGMAYFLREKVSLVYGTHSHVPTADERILPAGVGFVTDIGLTGSYDSIIGMESKAALKRMLTDKKVRLEPAKDNPWLCAIVAEIDENTGRCQKIERIRLELNNIDV